MAEENELLPLKVFNEARRTQIIMEDRGKSFLNGIACPKCGAELIDSSPGELLTSYPAQKNVSCPKCHHRDLRVE